MYKILVSDRYSIVILIDIIDNWSILTKLIYKGLASHPTDVTYAV
jgi:hypothetical protein